MDPSVDWNTLTSPARHCAQLISGRPGPGSSHQPSSLTSPDRSAACRSSVVRPPKEASFADGRLNALTVCLLDSLGVRHVEVSA